MGLTKVSYAMIKDAPANVQDYGAVGDGVTDDTAAIQAAINSATVIYLPPTNQGYLVNSSALTVPANKYIFGDENQTKIIHSNDDVLFKISGSYVSISGLRINSSASTISGKYVFYIDSSLGNFREISISDIEITSAFGVITDAAHASNHYILLNMTNIVSLSMKGNCWYLKNAFAYINLENCTATWSPSASNFIGFYIENNEGAYLTKCDASNGTVNSGNTSNTGFRIINSHSMWFNSCIADTLGGYGFAFANSYYIYLTNCISHGCAYVGFYFSASYYVYLTSCSSVGRNDQVYSVSSQANYQYTNCYDIQITNSFGSNATGNAYYMNNTIRYNVSNSRGELATNWGIVSDGTGNGITTGSSFLSNTAGNASLATSLDHIVSCVNTSGALFSLTGPGTA